MFEVPRAGRDQSQIVVVQTREAHMLQAVARIRAVGSPTRKRIVILCSIPLPDLPVTDLVPWTEFVSGVPCAIAGRLALLKKAIDRPDGPPLIGLRLSVAGAVEDAPHAFPTRNVSGEWRRGMPTEDLRELVGRYAATDRRAWSFVLLRKTTIQLTRSHSEMQDPHASQGFFVPGGLQ